jgi:hypothetical protein
MHLNEPVRPFTNQARTFYHPHLHDPEEMDLSWYSIVDPGSKQFFALVVSDVEGLVEIRYETLADGELNRQLEQVSIGRATEINPKAVLAILRGDL